MIGLYILLYLIFSGILFTAVFCEQVGFMEDLAFKYKVNTNLTLFGILFFGLLTLPYHIIRFAGWFIVWLCFKLFFK